MPKKERKKTGEEVYILVMLKANLIHGVFQEESP